MHIYDQHKGTKIFVWLNRKVLEIRVYFNCCNFWELLRTEVLSSFHGDFGLARSRKRAM